MKTAISLPDKLFKQAERLAKKQRLSRSELYARALQDYVDRDRDAGITAELNRFFDKHPELAEPEPGLMQIGLEAMSRVEWKPKRR